MSMSLGQFAAMAAGDRVGRRCCAAQSTFWFSLDVESGFIPGSGVNTPWQPQIFPLTMSVMTDKSIEPAGAPLEPKPNPPQRILVVEDDVVTLRINIKVLTKSGYAVDGAEDGAVAWDALQLNGYDLMVTDNDMPNVSGVDLLKRLYAARMALPVIMLSGTMPTAELERQPWLQIKAVLPKPCIISELLTTVRNVLLASGGNRAEIAPSPN
jgi:CheY-like chemotaxis protein